MKMKINELNEKILSLYGEILKNYDNLSSEDIVKLSSDIEKVRDDLLRKDITSSVNIVAKTPTYVTTSEAADILSVKRQTIYNYIKNGYLKTHKIGGVHRIKYDDLFQFISNFPTAYCTSNTISFEKKEGRIAIFQKFELYRIMSENKTSIYLFNEKWGGSFCFGKKQFKKNFSVKGELEYDTINL